MTNDIIEVAEELKKYGISTGKVDAERYKRIAKDYDVTGYPTLVL